MKNNSRLGLWILIPAWIIAFAARMAQICAGTDMTSGFLKDGNGFFMNACFWGAVVLALAGAVAAAVYDRRKGSALYETPVSQITDGRAAAIGFALLLPAMAALYEGYKEASIPEESNISPSPFMMCVNFLFGAVMLVTAFVILYKKEFKPGLGFAAVSGSVYYTLRGIGIFLERMAITTRPEYLIECISVILAAVFFMQLTKLLSGNEGRRTREALTVSGAAAAVTILGNSLAVIAAAFAGPAEVSSRIVTSSETAEWLFQLANGTDAYYMSWSPLAVFAAGVFITVTLIALYMKPSDKASAEPETAAEEAAAQPEITALPAEESASGDED